MFSKCRTERPKKSTTTTRETNTTNRRRFYFSMTKRRRTHLVAVSSTTLLNHLPSNFRVCLFLIFLLSFLVSEFDCDDDVEIVSSSPTDHELKPLNVNDLLGQIVDSKSNSNSKQERSHGDEPLVKLSTLDGRVNDSTDETTHHAPHRHHNKPVIVNFL